MTLKERIQAYCQYKGISVSQFERQSGLFCTFRTMKAAKIRFHHRGKTNL